jgi:putative PIN family toxin of toxin-antitoxin system
VRAILDPNVLVAALRSRQGASSALVSALPSSKFQPAISVPLYTEYLDVLQRPGMVPTAFSQLDIQAFCRYILSISHWQSIYFLWRPLLPDPKDDLVLEVAVAARAKYIVTFNLADFRGAEKVGILPITLSKFITTIGGLP